MLCNEDLCDVSTQLMPCTLEIDSLVSSYRIQIEHAERSFTSPFENMLLKK